MTTHFTGPHRRSHRGEADFRERIPHQRHERERLSDVIAEPRLPEQIAPASEVISARPAWGFYRHHVRQNLLTAAPLLFGECCAIALAVLLSASLASRIFPQTEALRPAIELLIASLVAFLTVYWLVGLYPGAGLHPVIELKGMLLGTAAAGMILLCTSALLGRMTPDMWLTISLLSMFMLLLGPVVRFSLRNVLCRRSWWGRPILIVGDPGTGEALSTTLQRNRSMGLHPVAVVGVDGLKTHEQLVRTASDIAEIASHHQACWAMVALSDEGGSTLPQVMRCCESIPNLIVVSGFPRIPTLWNQARDYGGVLGIHTRERLLYPSSQFLKRGMDIGCVLLGSLVLLPFFLLLFAVTWVCMRIFAPGPVFYGSERVGRNGRCYTMWKFRTMVVDADQTLEHYLKKHPELREEWELTQKLVHDPRMIPGIGKFLRVSSLDELPQLWNVLCGEMSLVGPRPIMPFQIPRYQRGYPLYQKVRPGITGFWQISGRNLTTYEEKIDCDAYYVMNWSLWLDLYILARTVKTVLLQEGAC
jgi:Undecaprenyl-phosphate galactose phosphotransferase WbaP